ncbi:aldolase [Arsenicibacter rosenii]|uniref:Aldolase n=2 Tax=Arsenicibacter rosenii TaxID=1750698 RepID=A0A1S2VR23_9BACT|nr:aldolase [Arsenicibacter rosenii]
MSLLEKIKSGRPVYGTCITSPAPMWPAVARRAGLDFVFLDTEHIPLGRVELTQLSQAFKAMGITPIVRIPEPNPFLACQAIDGGAVGVVAPYLETVDQVMELVGATKYRPLKGELLTRYLYNQEPMPAGLADYVAAYNAGQLCIANIESVPALERLDDLLSVNGLDGVFIGPHDLSISLGLPEQYDHPVFEDAVRLIIQKSKQYGLAVGIHFSLAPERQIRWMEEGVNLVIHSSDIALLGQRLQNDMRIIKAAQGESVMADNPSFPVV